MTSAIAAFSRRLSLGLNRIEGRGFVASVATLVSGQTVAAAIPILFAPILGRIYTPHDYGLLAAFIGIAVVLGAVGNWQYSQALLVETDEDRAARLVKICFCTSLITAAASLAIASGLALIPSIASALGLWLFALPLMAFVSGMTSCLVAVATRRSDYRFVATMSAVAALASSVVSLYLGWKGYGFSGLAAGYLVMNLTQVLAFSHRHSSALAAIWRVPLSGAASLALSDRKYPLFTAPGYIMRELAQGIPALSLNIVGASALAGQFSRAWTLLTLPINLVGISLSLVFQRAAARELQETGTCWPIYRKTTLALIIGALPCVILASWAAPALFTFYLGPQWEEAGYMARLLAPMMYLRMIAGPIWPVFFLFRANTLEFAIAALQLALIAGGAALVIAFDRPPIWQIATFVVASSAISALQIYMTWRLARPASPNAHQTATDRQTEDHPSCKIT
ncbi:hypothetical protein T281_17370 [Rhodomicrobium udaipurense JA643]|uniref:Oligosaccharide flippase family protein n=1 Tax=Rhodomicrobium udaipurense TaxID=1202716 RepID=A0A8I1GIX1_9HYPH|nr:oligosaccharide flippase family protein [Rhodomicrobium udaipurense]KAI93328.1 hypothetical protein T281_17370 [Rhodomicrobium udaipurense JA643]MBJ7544685.1 oligosaccharide flippase family protein [Rhodomicrobium udaipurense]